MRLNGSKVAVIAVSIALLAAACGTPASTEDVPSEAQTAVRVDGSATLLADTATEGEPAGFAPYPSADEEQAPIAIEALVSSEEIAEKLKIASESGGDDPVLIVSDDFSSPGWLEFIEDEFTSGYVDDAYELSVKPGGFSSAFGLNSSVGGSLMDFYFQIETRAYGPADNGYGIRFREQEAGFYEFTISSGRSGETISSGGTFSVDKFDESGIVRIVPFKTESASIAQAEGELNVLGVLALGPDISLYINGQEVASFSDPDHAAGSISLRVFPYFEGGSRTIFDNAAIWVPAD